jgi:hypothetical protein
VITKVDIAKPDDLKKLTNLFGKLLKSPEAQKIPFLVE